MSKNRQTSLCAIFLLKPNQEIPQETVESARTYLDHCFVASYGLSEEYKTWLKTEFKTVSVEFIDVIEHHYGDALNALIKQAHKKFDWALMLNANDKVCCFTPTLPLPQNDHIGLIRVKHGETETLQARLFHASSKINYNYPTAEYFYWRESSYVTLQNCFVQNMDGSLLPPTDATTNRFLLDAKLGSYPKSADLHFALAKLELSNQQNSLALDHFSETLELSEDEELKWLSHYLCGGIYQAQNDIEQASAHWLAAFELAPNRAEPLMRLSEVHFSDSDFNTAALLAEQATEIKPVSSSYREPAIYSHTATILKAKSIAQLGRLQEANQLLEDLKLNTQNLSIRSDLDISIQSINALSQDTAAKNTLPKSAQDTKNGSEQETRLDRPQVKKPKLTIGMATHDDYDGVYFSVMSIVLYHQDVLDDIEILIIDNNPNSKHGKAVRGLTNRVSQMRYISAEEYTGTAIREQVFHEAYGDYVLCIDCHVFLHQGAIRTLLDYFEANKDQQDLLHGPIYYDNHDHFSTHMSEEWNSGFYGRWATDQRGGSLDAEPFEIPMQGLGLFACVKDHWPGFNAAFRGFGGEEGYIHSKFRQRGGRVLCLPFLRWTHRFDRPNAPTYVNAWQDRVRNYLIGWDELELDTESILSHFSELLGENVAADYYASFLNEKMNLAV